MRLHAGYIRRSTATSSNPGNDSREAQESAIARLAGDDITLYVDWGISGSGDGAKRPEYRRLKADIAEDRVGSVTAYSLSRLGRNARELLGLVELCRERSVTLRTAMESIDTTSAFGRAMVGILAVLAELELEQGKERSASARQARKDRHAAAGLTVPASTPAYGYRHVTEHGLTRVERDPDVDLDVIARTYEEAGSVRGTAVLLNERLVPAPRGGLWNLTPLRRVLERLADDGVVTMPERNRRQRHAPRTAALFAGLVLCHCGRRMTPNVTRGQLYCAAARAHDDHGRMAVTEKALVAALRPEADAYLRTIKLDARQRQADNAAAERAIERRQAALDAKLDVDRITPDAYKAATSKLIEELADLRRDARIERTLSVEAVPEWPEPGEDPSAMNRHLRRIWTHVQLDPEMAPTASWRDSRWRYDPELQLRQEAELRDPEAARLVVFPAGAREAARPA
jgi:DNA invertase Pin-like site-specific DNA recombinase